MVKLKGHATGGKVGNSRVRTDEKMRMVPRMRPADMERIGQLEHIVDTR